MKENFKENPCTFSSKPVIINKNDFKEAIKALKKILTLKQIEKIEKIIQAMAEYIDHYRHCPAKFTYEKFCPESYKDICGHVNSGPCWVEYFKAKVEGKIK